MIKFGTDGWRAIIADEFTFGNVEIVVQAIANHLKETGRTDKGIVIGYDQRFLSDRFAERAAEVLLGNGLKVHFGENVLPTPVTAFAIAHWKHDGGLMFTASHNPPEYNGIKFIPHYAGPAMPDVTDGIEAQLKKVMADKQIQRMNIREGKDRRLFHYINPTETYLEHLKSLLDVAAFQKHPLKILVDPMHGAGIRYLSRILEEMGCHVEEINYCRDPLFGGSLPEPTEEILRGLSSQVKHGDFDLGLALDGDADRFGIIDSDGTYITPNQALPLLLDHCYVRGKRGPVARTVATSHLLDVIAQRYEEHALETPVGFKYIGSALRDQGVLLGGEESGGLSIQGHIPEKDGILACCLMAEVMATRGQSFQALLQELAGKYGNFVSERLDKHYDPAEKETLLARIKELNLDKVAGVSVRNRLTTDGTKFLLEDESWCLLRPSGTEPLVRIYVESSNKDKLKAIQADVIQKIGLTL